MTRGHWHRLPVALLLLVVFTTALWDSGQRFLADMTNQQARHFIDRWRGGKLTLANERLDELQTELSRALAYDPENPALQEDLARLLVWRTERSSFLDPAVRKNRQQARQLFVQAARQRPTSERAWASVAALHFVLGEIDSEFSSAMTLALRRGPWNSEIQMVTIRIGLASWQVLSPDVQRRLRIAIHNQAHWRLAPKKAVLGSLIQGFHRTELLCLLETGPAACQPV